jgi:hypothetical protein
MSDNDAVITLKDVYTQVTMLVGHMQAVDTRNLMADQIHTDQEQRIRALERWRYAMPASIVVGLGSLGTALAAFLGQH